MNTPNATTQYNPVDEFAYGVMISVAYRIARMDLDGEVQAAANEYTQHTSAMNAASKTEFDRMLATAAANLQTGWQS